MVRRHAYNTGRAASLHGKQLHDYIDGRHGELIKRSAFGLTKVYNELPQSVVDRPTVKLSQRDLHGILREKAENGEASWMNVFSRR